MDAQPDANAISRAIVDHFGLWWTDEARDAILKDVGDDGLKQVEEIISDAGSAERWLYANPEAAYYQTQAMLREKYPYLSDAAVLRAANSAAYGWK